MAVVAFVAAGSFASSMLLLVAYDRTQRSWLGWVESFAFLVLYVSLGVLVVGVHGDLVDGAPILVWISTIVGAAGAVVAVGAETATMFFRVPFTRVAALVTVAFGGILLWMAGLSAAGLIGDTLPPGLGWLGVAMVVTAIVVIGLMSRDLAVLRGERAPGPGELAGGAIPFLAVIVWLAWLGSVI